MIAIEVVDLRVVNSDGKLKAFVDMKFGNEIIIKGFSVLEGKRGLFVAMPRKAGADGRWYDLLVVLNDETKLEIETQILTAYDKEAVTA